MKKVAILLTVFNRKEITIQGLKSLCDQFDDNKDFVFEVFMTDDGCTDGTRDIVKEIFPYIHIIEGSGYLYWSGGMRLAWDTANEYDTFDYFIWFNDDSILFPYALRELFDSSKELGPDTIISGAFCDANTGCISYGGWSKDFHIIDINPNKYEPIYYMNGNLVLIPSKIYNVLGNIDKHYLHSLGDWDYSGRAIKKGFNVVLTKKYVGEASRHDVRISQQNDPALSIKKRWEALYSRKNNPSVLWHFNKTHFGLIKAVGSYVLCHFIFLFPSLSKYHPNKVVD